MAETIDWPPPRRPPRGRGRLFLLVVAGLLLLSGGTALSYYVDALWFESLGVGDVFWTTLRIQSLIFSGFALATFLILYGSFVALKPARLGELAGLPILINGQPIRLPVEPVIRLIALGGSVLFAIITASAMASEWTTLGLYWYAGADVTRSAAAGAVVDPVFNRPLTFYFFTLPAWQLVSGWLLTLAVIASAVGLFFVTISGGTRLLVRRSRDMSTWRGLSIALAALLLMRAVRTFIGRYDRLFDDHTIFAGVTYTDAHVTIPGQLILSIALLFA